MGKLLGGSQTSKTEIPAYIEDASKANIARANEIARIGYTPYYGPDVAAFNGTQQAAFGNTNQMADAFGMAQGRSNMPQAQAFAGGVQGYSSAPMFEQALEQLRVKQPGQYDAIRAMFINPQTGAAPTSQPVVQQPITAVVPGAPGAMPVQPQNGGNSTTWEDNALGGSLRPSRGGSDRDATGSTRGGAGGYTGLRDMVDGGGPGASGSRFSGGGLLSGVGNGIRDVRDAVRGR